MKPVSNGDEVSQTKGQSEIKMRDIREALK